MKHLFDTAIGFCFAAVLASAAQNASADTASAAWQAWRATAIRDHCFGKTDNVRLGVDIHSNYLLRGLAVFHRPQEDLLAQKIALLPELRWQYSEATELSWDSAIAMQARELTRGEIRHAESVQNFRAHHCLPLDQNWTILAGGNLALSIQDLGGLRYELGAALIRQLSFLTLELGVLQHQALWGDPPLEWAFSHAHFEAFYHFQTSHWTVLPYARIMGEQNTFDWSGRSALAFQGGIRGHHTFSFAPLRWTFATDYLQRFDLDEWTFNLSIGAQWGFKLNGENMTTAAGSDKK